MNVSKKKFFNLERSSKRSRILDFFRGRGRPAIPADKNSNDNQQF
ncbi:unnamed protein product, partial [Rotaria socialis]